ncbi:MAG: glycosyltransferase family A protein, partial [Actinomycetota bacterium]|nr:glycosyltransferase family A protein [Actinomycetota bacterium]
MPEFTAIIPSYNRGHLLERAAASIWSQTLAPKELIIVDDGSTDDTAKIVTELAGNNRYVHQDNAGGASARNRGVAEASTEWVAFLDSDDVWLPNHLELIAAAIEATDGAADL